MLARKSTKNVLMLVSGIGFAIMATVVTVPLMHRERGIDNTELASAKLLENGPCWMKCNVGAMKPEELGCCFGCGSVAEYKWQGGTWVNGCPPRVRNLLLRLEEAERVMDVEMAILTIEELRSLPGSPVWEMEDSLVRRLGALNLVLLFKMKCPRWVSLVTVKNGDTASSIASEYGSTVASLNRLNDNALGNMKVGQSIYAINHPRFSLVVHRRTQNADLCLNGKLFKRYELKSVSGLNEGVCEWGGILLSVTEHKELEMLLPQNTSVLVSEM